ncbi:MAG: WGxxGxxG family protein [Nostoc sp. DedVER02]|uniref:WGxxGxxG family protein n=1 Tax=unclassified Nostoc TaxID=2593658 RepID=UPI002AD4C97F|nr:MULTISPECIES: WGxxGxxG family protein [unclassified Nostoc]MDZ7987795.1 WGxxGxxG family protein [Nostoc sp. DedVER02]MDZ8116293.1 WGxxGxxG family protein [Nostoc sp. DedVER01b]
MKRFNVSKILGSTVLALSLATLPTVLPASAQTTSTSDGTTTTTTDNTSTDRNYRDGDWGLLGLLGLFGLFGRKSRKADDNVGYRDPNAVGSSGSRSNY